MYKCALPNKVWPYANVSTGAEEGDERADHNTAIRLALCWQTKRAQARSRAALCYSLDWLTVHTYIHTLYNVGTYIYTRLTRLASATTLQYIHTHIDTYVRISNEFFRSAIHTQVQDRRSLDAPE